MTNTNLTRARRAPRILMLTGILLAVAALVAGCATPAPSPTAHPAHLAVGSSTHMMISDGMTRSYRVYRPSSLPAGTAAPLVVMLHGSLGTAEQAEKSYDWDAEADAGHFVVVYPDGYKRTWAASDGCCGPAATSHLDDVGFITSVVTAVSREVPIDQRRIYATGISNGAAMAYRLACDTDVFAAIGPDSSNVLGECPSPKPISVIHIHGTADQTFPYGGGPGKRDNGGSGKYPADTSGPPIPTMIDTWRATDSCGAASASTKGAVTTSVSSCPDGRAVELITIDGAGHQWPGSSPKPSGAIAGTLDTPFAGLDATHTIWTFFRAHPKP